MASKEDIQKLRESTGAGVMDTKKALEEAGGDMNKATELLKEKGLSKAAKRADREIKDGVVKTYTHNDRVGAVLRLGCETDFVAKSDIFQELAQNLVLQIVAMDPKDVDELLEQPFVKNEKVIIDEMVKGAIATTGENIKVDSFYRLEL